MTPEQFEILIDNIIKVRAYMFLDTMLIISVLMMEGWLSRRNK